MLAAIPYETFPIIELGPLHLRTFGLMVGIGVLVGAWVAGAYCERFGVERDQTYRIATRMVLFGVIGARITWDLSHWDQINSPLDLIAVWKGGLQFSGGFIAAIIVGYPTFKAWSRLTRWRMLDGYALGLTIGLAFGRVGCTSVGEHFGSTWGSSWFPLMTRYEGGSVREGSLGPTPLVAGTVFHNTSIYELLYLLVLFAVLWRVAHRTPAVTPGTVIGIFCAVYAVSRFGTDLLRINDETILGLTGAQYLCIAIAVAAVWILRWVRPSTAALAAAEVEAEFAAEDAGADESMDASTVPPTKTDADAGPAHTTDL